MGFTGLLLAGCATLQDAQPLDYQCPHDLRFTARLYQDMAMLDGMRGHVVLERVTQNTTPDAAPLRYADDSVRAEFALGMQGRLVRLDYTNIPQPLYCTRIAAQPGTPLAPPRAAQRAGPRPPPPPLDPNLPARTNIRTSEGLPVKAGY
jgi:hypothetical protein